MNYVFNLKEMIYVLVNIPIWLRYVTIRKLITLKYPELSSDVNRLLVNRLLYTVKNFFDYKFIVGTEYLVTEVIE